MKPWRGKHGSPPIRYSPRGLSCLLVVACCMAGLLLTAGKAAAEKPLRVVTRQLEPFVIEHDGEYSGFSIELWEDIAERMEAPSQIREVDVIITLL